jgi:aryl-alcohol dehydrogenase-like predicted oxidoreductase
LDSGINWIDTAPVYGEGKASRLVGKVLKSIPENSQPYVFTKFGLHVIDGERVKNGSAAQVVADCEDELKRLGIERIDCFQLHWPTPQPMQETADACARLFAAGKIRAIGVSNFNCQQLANWHATGIPLHTVQNAFSIINPQPSTDVLPWCIDHHVGLLAYSPLFRGMLSGTWTADKTFPPGDHRGERDDFRGYRLKRRLEAIEALREYGNQIGLDVPQLAVGRLLAHKGVAGVIVGARNADQGRALGRLATTLNDAINQTVDAIMTRCEQAIVPHEKLING